MIEDGTPPEKAKAPVLWILWIAILMSLFLYQFKLGHGLPKGHDARPVFQNPMIWPCVFTLLAAAIIRWRFIPKATDLRRLLVLLVIGLALSEAVTFFGIFLFQADMPETKTGLFVLSVLSVLQFMPLYAKAPAAETDSFRQP